MSTTFPVKLLVCPFCGYRFELFLYSFQPHYGLVRCTCREFPIVYSIPILIDFPEAAEILDLIREREPKLALMKTLAIFATNPEFQQIAPYDPKTKEGQGRMLQIIDDPLISFQQTLQTLCKAQEADEMFYRYAHRSVVSGLALTSLSSDNPGYILHLGCGTGHLERVLANRVPPSMLIGIEENFSFLYAARKYMSPDSHFVFADLSKRFPLKNEAFDVVLADERIGQSAQRALVATEISRIARAEDGAVLASGILTESESFSRRFKAHRLRRLSIKRLVEGFVKEHAVDATKDDANHGAASVVATKQAAIFQRKEMENLVSCRSPRVNPVYITSEIGEMLKLERRKDLPPNILDPSLIEAGALPERVEFPKQLIRDLQEGTLSPEAVDLLFRMVLVDLPLDYS